MGCKRGCMGFGLSISAWVGILWTIFLIVKIDAIVDWNWAVVFIPFWILLIPLLAASFFFWRWTGAFVWVTFSEVALIVFTVFLVCKLELESEFMSWWLVFTPAWVMLASLLLIHQDWPEFIDKYTDRIDDDTAIERMLVALPRNFLVSFAALLILLAIDLDGVYPLTWRIKYIPVWYFLAIVVLEATSAFTWSCREGCFNYVVPLMITADFAVFVVLMYLKLTSIVPMVLAIVWIPLWLPETVLFFVAFGFACCL